MKCPICFHEETRVLDSRSVGDELAVRRRRECAKCGWRFSTYEEIEILDLNVVKRDGRTELYAREKLERGLRRALEKRPIDKEAFKKLVGNIERDIQVLVKEKKTNEISSADIGDIVMNNLAKVDQVAYIRFASVYKSFQDVAEFKKELTKL
jgi:transcriptional repressor NrdR